MLNANPFHSTAQLLIQEIPKCQNSFHDSLKMSIRFEQLICSSGIGQIFLLNIYEERCMLARRGAIQKGSVSLHRRIPEATALF